MQFLLQTLAPALWALCVAALAWQCLDLAREITYVELGDGRRQERSLPLAFRALLPFAANFKPLFTSPAFARRREAIDRRIVAAGFEGLLAGWEFMALQVLNPLAMGALWAVAICLLGTLDDTVRANFWLFELVGVALFAAQPGLWLRQTIRARQKSIQRAMPFMIDLLTLSVEAGIDFMSALQRATAGRRMDPLNEELSRTSHEIRLGTPRRKALRNLAARVDMPDMRSFCSALVQADELGVGIGTILRIQSDQMRQRRFDRAERLANEAPVKMLFPLMLFIFPAVFIVLLGPILSRVAGNIL
ncbi:MAG: type II secretion system F family protein [Kiritimatiellae bacterium]|nr:type II secretion system F family protein [Kiritimatiellia bacterium]